MGGGGGGGGASSKLKRAARKIVQTCGSFSRGISAVDHHHTSAAAATMSSGSPTNPSPKPGISTTCGELTYATEPLSSTSSTKNLCAICLDPLSYGASTSPGKAVFTAQCSHAFHFGCISSNVRHGNVTCPICRAHWTQLPRNLNPPCCNQSDPVLQILDDSIATFRVHRRSFLRSARYNDDDPIEPDHTPNHPRLHFSLIPVTLTHHSCHQCSHQSLQVPRPNSYHSHGLVSLNHLSCSSSLLAVPPGGDHFAPTVKTPYLSTSGSRAYLSVTLAHQTATDLVLVASPNGPHLRLIKQSMALVVFSLRPIDRLAIVTYSSSAARVFPLKRMTSYGKRTALQVIDRLFYMGQADPIEGLKKGVKILRDCAHKNPQSCILHLSDSPTRSYHRIDTEFSVPIHRFHVGFGFGTSNGFVMHEFEEFLTRVLGGVIKEIQLRIGEDARIVRLGELRGGEERRIPLILDDSGHICVEYSYIEGGVDECTRRGEIVVGIGDERERTDGTEALDGIPGRSSNVESLDYHDPYRARRWAKHLHGYRL